MITTSAAAALIAARLQRSMSVVRVQQLCARGDFPGARRPGRDWMIPRSDVEAYQPRPGGNPGHFNRQR
jgi:hypothetical protein